MGYREWRERALARVEGVADRLDDRAAGLEARGEALSRERDAERVEAVSVSREEWMRRRARALGEDHDDLLARAELLGVPAPVPDRRMRGRVFGALGELVVMDGAGVEGGTADAYEAWRDRIVVEESMVTKEARGESLSLGDRLVLKAARFGSK